MNFKDQIAKDLVVFFNIDEFADMHNINGQQVICVVDTDANKTRSGQQSEQYDGIFLSTIKVFIKVSDLQKKPVYGKVFRLDEKPYIVIECAENIGMYEITLGLNDT